MGESTHKKMVIILLATFAYRATSNMLQTSVPLYAYSLNSSDFVVSLIVSISSLTSLISLLYFGLRKVNLGKGIQICLVMTAVSMPLFLLTNNQILLGSVYGFVSFWTGALAMLLLTSAALVGDYKSSSNNIAIFTSMLSLSLALGPLIQSGILAATGDNLVYSIVLFGPLVGLAAFFSSSLKFENSKARGKFEIGFAPTRSFWAGVMVNESMTFPFLLVVTFGGIFAENHFQISYGQIEELFGAFFLVSFFARFFLVRKMIVSRRVLIWSSFLAMFVSLVTMFVSTNMPEFLIGLVLLGYSHGVVYPTASTMVSTSVQREKLLQANSIYSLIDSVDYLIAAPILGVLSDIITVRSTMLFTELPVLVTLVGFLVMSRTTTLRVNNGSTT